MREHLKKWGWVNFLKEIAKSKVFDVVGNGKNSIDSAKEAKLFSVLVYASEEKQYQDAQALDYERDMKKYK